jgi:hypothetical protein
VPHAVCHTATAGTRRVTAAPATGGSASTTLGGGAQPLSCSCGWAALDQRCVVLAVVDIVVSLRVSDTTMSTTESVFVYWSLLQREHLSKRLSRGHNGERL